jgi:sulfhydrogenase subunit beta (sulfur reductase)
MKGTYLLTYSALAKLVDKFAASGDQVYGPVKTGSKTFFRQVKSLDQCSFDYIQTDVSAKELVFPKYETVLSYRKEGKDIQINDIGPSKPQQVMLLGGRPCDAVAFQAMEKLFNWDYRDEFFNRRQAALLVVSMSCTSSDEYCFCTSVDSSPSDTYGSDILLTPIDSDKYLAEIITERAEMLVKQNTELFSPAPNVRKEDFLAKVEPAFNSAELKKQVEANFENDALWEKQALRCLGCGACAFICPVCTCFDIQEQKHGKNGTRLRCWDSCGLSLFTIHTSGHNPREYQYQRWRQRVMHKFSYMPDRLGVKGCTGCGRCSRACQVDMNLKEHLTSIK